MATKPQGGKNAKKPEPSRGVFPEATRDVFGELAPNDLAVDFGEIHPGAVHAVIAGICRAGGYIGFSAPAGGAAVKVRATVGDASGERWVRSGPELAATLVTLKKQLDDYHTREAETLAARQFKP